ncbi:LOW QUALITY PROTEIN: reticulocalbin-3-like [Heliangelus exortis]|uniref:LOW QUALITY PROTEIN: reticulocalbin-3-like n=1 Tax=Heliangelus exortis TaxID=472823 RepID=UPI003A8EFE23
MGARRERPHVGSAPSDWSGGTRGGGAKSVWDPREGTGKDAFWGVSVVGSAVPGGGGPPPRGFWGGGFPPPGSWGGGAPHDHSQGFAYDHQVFLGSQEAQTFDQLTPQESQRRLGLLVGYFFGGSWWGVIDGDGDGAVTASELGAWMERRHRRDREETLERSWSRHDRDRDGVVTWEEYRHETYGPPEEGEPRSELGRGLPESWRMILGGTQQAGRYRELLARDQRRFRSADPDGDGATRTEFAAFLHPEDFEHMRAVVVTETLEDLDRDRDGFVQLEEYIAELYEGSPGTPEPEWVREERAQFRGGRDRDGDGRLDPSELEHWLRPPSSDWVGVEAAHLLHHSDQQQDGHLTKEEILGHWELFVGSQATNYGQDLERPHDEL